MDPTDHITELLRPGGSVPADQLLPLVYDALRDLARGRLARERPGQTLQPTALVHEAYLRVAGSDGGSFHGRRHFFAAAAEAMRRILIDQARNKGRLRRGAGASHVDLDDVDLAIEPPGDDLLAVHEALSELEAADPNAREIVNLRYFAGLTAAETADVLGVSRSTVDREWRFIRTFLLGVLRKDELS